MSAVQWVGVYVFVGSGFTLLAAWLHRIGRNHSWDAMWDDVAGLFPPPMVDEVAARRATHGARR